MIQRLELPVSLPDTADLRAFQPNGVENPEPIAPEGGVKGKTGRRGSRVARANRNKAKLGRSWVYFAQAGENGPVKIGQTRDVHTRIRALGAMHYEEIRLIGVIPETFIPESRLHIEFDQHRIRGEWFRPDPEILAVAAAGQAVYGDGYVHLIPDELRTEYAVLMPISLLARAS